ncbi:MAG: response regulator [Desulfobulbaceae bacterium]|nr:response regulator [Desulfobulbaceae bacterium]
MSPQNESTSKQNSVDARPQTILVIDDDPLVLDALASWLSPAGFLTLTAQDGASGLALIHSQPVDLVLTDLVMPGCDGFQVLSTLHKEYPELPVIIISGIGNLQDSIQSLRLGAWDYISKPLSPLLLLHQIEKALERATLLKENNRYRQYLQHEVEERTAQLQQRTADLELANMHLQKEIVARQQIETKLKEANERWQSTFDSMPDFISIHDHEFTVIKTNRALADFLGQSPDDLIGKKCYQLFHGTCSPWKNCPNVELLATGSAQSCEVIDPHIGIPLLVSVSPIKLEGGFIGSIHIARNITQQKRLEEARQRNKNLESISVLCGGLAHDFNNLLTALSGYIDLSKRENPSGQLGHWLDSAKMATNLAADLTKQLLIFSKGGHPHQNHIPVPLLIEESLAVEKNNFGHISLELHLADDVWPITGDKEQLRTVIRNIFYNAAEAMPNGGTLTIKADNLPKGSLASHEQNQGLPALDKDTVRLTFTDQGTGISPEIIDKVFDPYFTTSAKGASKGKGLGLALCHSIITKHHGQIAISSEKDRGATVSIYLPANPTALHA